MVDTLLNAIRSFVRAAEQLGVNTTAPPLVESGPEELRTATRAFNLMQERLRRFVEDVEQQSQVRWCRAPTPAPW